MLKAEVDEEWAEGLTELNEKIHEMQRKDKNIFDKGTRALVSHVRAYSKHECNLLLRVQDLDLGKVATSYGLLQLPKMPEMKEKFRSSFLGPSEKINVNTLEYKDKVKQQAYQKKKDVYKETGEWPGQKKVRKSTEAWGEANKKREFRKENRKKRQEAKKTFNEKKASGVPVARKRKNKYSQEELEELVKDIAAIKKFKKNKITKEELDTEMGFDSDSSD